LGGYTGPVEKLSRREGVELMGERVGGSRPDRHEVAVPVNEQLIA